MRQNSMGPYRPENLAPAIILINEDGGYPGVDVRVESNVKIVDFEWIDCCYKTPNSNNDFEKSIKDFINDPEIPPAFKNHIQRRYEYIKDNPSYNSYFSKFPDNSDMVYLYSTSLVVYHQIIPKDMTSLPAILLESNHDHDSRSNPWLEISAAGVGSIFIDEGNLDNIPKRHKERIFKQVQKLPASLLAVFDSHPKLKQFTLNKEARSL